MKYRIGDFFKEQYRPGECGTPYYTRRGTFNTSGVARKKAREYKEMGHDVIIVEILTLENRKPVRKYGVYSNSRKKR